MTLEHPFEIPLSITAETVQAYIDAVNFDRPYHQSNVPITFVMRSFALPPLREIIKAACRPGTVPVQTRQVMRRSSSLTPNCPYILSGTVMSSDADGPRPGVQLVFRVKNDVGATLVEGELDFLCLEKLTP